MHRLPILAAISLSLAASFSASAQNQPDLSALRSLIQSGQWKAVDFTSLTPQQRCAVYQFLNDSLDEIGARGRAQADLVSAYLDQAGLGSEFIKFAPPADAAPLTFDDAKKVAAAMLAGPLAKSTYTTMYADQTDAQALSASEWMNETSSQRKWGEVAETRRQLLWMSAFLKSKDLVSAFQAWAPGEVQRRQQEVAAQMASKREAYQAQQKARQKQTQQEIQSQQQQLSQQQAQTLTQEQAQTAAQLQQALSSAQQTQGGQVVPSDGGVYDGAYGYGLADLGADAWYRNAAYRGEAAAAVDHRMGGWHGGGRR